MKRTTIYGSHLCPGCVEALEALATVIEKTVFLDITTDLANFKAFLKLRDGNPLFNTARQNGQIGIPFYVFSDGTQSLDTETSVNKILNEN